MSELQVQIARPVITTSNSSDSVVTAVDDNPFDTTKTLALAPGPITSINLDLDLSLVKPTPSPAPLGEINNLDLKPLTTSLETLFRASTSSSPPLRIVGLIGSTDKGCRAYARTIEKQCTSLGVIFERRDLCVGINGEEVVPSFEKAKGAMEEINRMEEMDGLIVFTPIFGGDEDQILRNMIPPRLDIEALSPRSQLAHEPAVPLPYERIFEGGESTTKGAVFPCTPMAVCLILMSVPGFWATGSGVEPRALEGKTVVIINRSEVLGRPLAAMLAKAGATVFSIDIADTLIFKPSPSSPSSYSIEQTPESLIQSTIFSQADVIISAVPSAGYKVPLEGVCLKQNVGLVNVATTDNFGLEAKERAGWVVARVGGVTRWCLLLNALMLRKNRAGESRGTRHEER